jgi:hypothetical protein
VAYRGKSLVVALFHAHYSYSYIHRGGTASDAVILNSEGRIVGTSHGPCTNPWVGSE